LHGLVGEVEEGLAAVAVEEDVQAESAILGVGWLGGVGDVCEGCELVGWGGDFEA